MHEDMIARTKIKAKYTNSGEWLLRSPEFLNWDTGNDKVPGPLLIRNWFVLKILALCMEHS